MTERQYSEDEVAAIFEQASKAQRTGRRQLPPGEGMTLAELQEIGREVGLPPELVAEAARSLERRGRSTSQRFLGLPLGVGRIVDVGRRISDEEWERLVVDLRDTFDARGRVRTDGPFREWTNGNLQALLEPTESGHRLRLRTLKGNARSSMIAGLSLLGISAAILIVSVLTGGAVEVSSVGLLSVLGLGMFGFGALSLPVWARRRRRQMEGVAARLALAAESESGDQRSDAGG